MMFMMLNKNGDYGLSLVSGFFYGSVFEED